MGQVGKLLLLTHDLEGVCHSQKLDKPHTEPGVSALAKPATRTILEPTAMDVLQNTIQQVGKNIVLHIYIMGFFLL